MAGGIAHLTNRARHSHARLAVGHFRLRSGASHVPRHQDDPPARGCPSGNRSADRAEALQTIPGVLRRDPLDAGLGRRSAGSGFPAEDRRKAADAEAQHPAAPERLHGDRLDEGDHDPRRERLLADLRVNEREGPLLYRSQVRSLADDRDQGPSDETRDGRVRAAGEHRRPRGEAGGIGQHHPRAHGPGPGRTHLETGANRMKAGIVSYGGDNPPDPIRPKDNGGGWGGGGAGGGGGGENPAQKGAGPGEKVNPTSLQTPPAVADISHTVSYTTDTPDFWRREGQRYPSHGGRFTGEPAYFKHVVNCAQLLFKRASTTAEDYDYAVFHQPNGKFPVRVAKQLGFKDPQIDAGLCVRDIGNTYSGAIMVGLCAILDEAEAGDRIFAVGYGSGAGSDAFDLTVTDEITKIRRDATPTIKEMIADHAFVDYATYAKYRGKILMREA